MSLNRLSNVYRQDKDFSKITRSCKNDQSNSKSNGRNEITSFTVANIQCLNTIDGIQVRELEVSFQDLKIEVLRVTLLV